MDKPMFLNFGWIFGGNHRPNPHIRKKRECVGHPQFSNNATTH
jgi:hypothetical protein